MVFWGYFLKAPVKLTHSSQVKISGTTVCTNSLLLSQFSVSIYIVLYVNTSAMKINNNGGGGVSFNCDFFNQSFSALTQQGGRGKTMANIVWQTWQ